MFFHIDESGNTGNNLFDENQPQLSYGLLSSVTNVDVLGKAIHQKILKQLDVETIHANVLGVEKLTQITPLLISLQKKMHFDFDYFFIHKKSFALSMFFDAVFDSGLNEAVSFISYWTPMRFLIIGKLNYIFDDELLKESWNLCIHKRINTQEKEIQKLLTELNKRVNKSPLDARSKEIITDALLYGIAYPLNLDFGTPDQKFVSPNAICFQFIISAMAMRLKKKKKKDASSIIVDRQSEFNTAQIKTHDSNQLISEGLKNISEKDKKVYLSNPLFKTLDDRYVMREGIPQEKLTILNSEKSIGLQIVDVYLWIVNRMLNNGPLSNELKILGASFLKRSMADGISLDAMSKRWQENERLMPSFESLSQEQHELNEEQIKKHRAKVKSLKL